MSIRILEVRTNETGELVDPDLVVATLDSTFSNMSLLVPRTRRPLTHLLR